MINIKQDLKNCDLFLEYNKEKNIEIRNEIFNKYQYLADIISKKYANKGIDHDDIYQIASIGLIYAIERYDITKGYEFTSFATPTILGEIKKYFRDKGWAIKVPRRIQEISKKINDMTGVLSFKLNRMPTINELSENLGYSREEILEAMEAGKLFTSQSLNINLDKGNEFKDIELMDIISDETNNYEIFENYEFLKKSLELLNKLEKEILVERFYNNSTQNEIAKKLNISQMTVSRLEKRALEKIKETAYK